LRREYTTAKAKKPITGNMAKSSAGIPNLIRYISMLMNQQIGIAIRKKMNMKIAIKSIDFTHIPT